MSTQFILRASLEVNGTVVADFSSITEKAITARKPVNLMYSTGIADKTKRYELEVEYKYPRNSTPIDFLTTVANGTITVEYDGGERHDYGGVNCLEQGDAKIDGETELMKNITFMASSKDGDFGA